MPALAEQPSAGLLRVEDHLPLAYSIARRYLLQGRLKGLELGDLRQVAALGLLKAARRFRPARGARFSTFATLIVRQVMHTYLWRQKRLAGAPRPAGNDGPGTDFFAAIGAREAESNGLEVAELVKRLLGALPPRERALVEGRFGLKRNGPRTIAALAREHGVSRQWVSRLLLRALERMRREVRRSLGAASGNGSDQARHEVQGNRGPQSGGTGSGSERL
jgi:RNA polymerase sigma factor (sigma-70 family)